MASIELPASLNVGSFDFEVKVMAYYTMTGDGSSIELGEVHLNSEPIVLAHDQYALIEEEILQLIN